MRRLISFRLGHLVSVVALFGCLSVASIAAESARTEPPASHRLVDAAQEPQNWLSYGGTYTEQRYSALEQIDTNNVSRLGLAWSFDFDTNRGQESTPLAVDGVLYVTTAWSKVYALDGATGKRLWLFDPDVPGQVGFSACCDVVNRGAAYDEGKVFVGTLDGRLICLDAKTGKPIWSVVTVDQSKPYTITGAPRVVRGKVLIGNGGAEYGVRGYVTAYDEVTGKLVWRFYTVPGDPSQPDHAASDDVMKRIARPTWYGDQYWKLGGGGTVWDSIVYDAELNQLYIGGGNGGPWNRKIRSEDKGDNLFLSAIIAVDPDTGKYLWHYQETPGETWDFTACQQMILADLTIDGRPRKALMHAPKNGFFYVIDRLTGKPISAEKFAPANWAERIDPATWRPVENPDARFQQKPFLAISGGAGAHNWQPMSYSPKTGLVYIPAQQVPLLYTKDTQFVYRPGFWNLGVDMMNNPLPKTPEQVAALKQVLQGWLLAWDPVKQKEVWRVSHSGPWNGGTLSTAGDLVFQGLADATFRAYRATDGKELWRFPTQSAVLPGPISYRIGDAQYVAIVVGDGGGFALTLPSFDTPKPVPPGRILVFRLDGTASLPKLAVVPAAPLNPAKERWNTAQIAEGRTLFNNYCANCHALGTLSSGIVPDLKRSPALSSADAWQEIVYNGALEKLGMISFAKFLNASQIDEIRGYVSSEATAQQDKEQGHN